MNRSDRAMRFAGFHTRGNPLVLYNAWDVGSARAILDGGAQAIGTSSWSVAVAQGYRDGEDLPIEIALQTAAQIAAAVDVPVTVDFEGGYSDDDARLAENVARLLEVGIVGVNFEDRVVKGLGLYGVDHQARRIAAIRAAAERIGTPLFINARTDVFFQHGKEAARYADEALDRARAYAAAGASGFFIPGLVDDALIGKICDNTPLPVNVMVMEGVPSKARLIALGVARISYGPIPYVQTMARLRDESHKIFS